MIRSTKIVRTSIACLLGGVWLAACGTLDDDRSETELAHEMRACPDASTDAPVPPLPECLPACIRAALEPCLPVLDSCTRERKSDEFGNLLASTLCSADANWSSTYSYSGHSYSNTITIGGASCFVETANWASLIPRAYVWRDATGNQIAMGLEPTVGASTIDVWCTPGLPQPGDIRYTISTGCMRPTARCGTIVDGTCS